MSSITVFDGAESIGGNKIYVEEGGRGGGTFVRKSFCILPCPDGGGGCVGIVPRHQICSSEGVPKDETENLMQELNW
jgi:hypothetical protein